MARSGHVCPIGLNLSRRTLVFYAFPNARTHPWPRLLSEGGEPGLGFGWAAKPPIQTPGAPLRPLSSVHGGEKVGSEEGLRL